MKWFRTIILSFSLLLPLITFAVQTVDINTADAEALAEAITGVGIKRAQAIIDYRKNNGPFKSVDDLLSVKGIGGKILDKNRSRLTTGKAGDSP